ncbi:hypothetical protein HII31_02916 [Pseudocercospora fuligena]|uniref:Uncharacterized protein n=1 Tax=Pseudocercospora fuligena TaxID=685502 RepID=A0A8H6RNV3_9PEZI|nr:hypothetical protein HII31_02916 [Pseudocercospora fuligena]
MAEVESSLVYRGFWSDHGRGPILGFTYTIDQRAAPPLVALLAIVVGVACASLWDLILFVYHRWRSTTDEQEWLYLQQQILLRSLATPITFMMDCLKLQQAWRHVNPRATRRLLVMALASLVFAFSTLLASTFSSYLFTTDNAQVLLKPSRCQLLDFRIYALDRQQEVGVIGSSSDAKARTYAQQCYGNGSLPSSCNFWVKPRFELKPQSTKCPFNYPTCVENGTEALILDTGYLDSFNDFGINAGESDRVQMRRIATCAPLNISQHIEVLDANGPVLGPLMAPIHGHSPFPARSAWVAHYGQTRFYPNNITYVHFDVESNLTRTYTSNAVKAFASPRTFKLSSFTPMTGFPVSTSDLTLIFIATNRALSTLPIEGHIYSAHRPIQFAGDPLNTTYFLPDRPVGAMGCTERYQYCIKDESGRRHCTAPGGASFDDFETTLPSANKIQLATLELLGQASVLTGLVNAASTEPSFLDSNTHFEGSVLEGLPSDQWKADVVRLEGYTRSYLQNTVLMRTTGYSIETEVLRQPQTQSEERLCRSQKVVKPAGFVNIAVVSVLLILAFAGFAATLDFVS